MLYRDEFTDQLSAYLDNELDAGPRARVEAHLAACAGCRAVLADLRDIVAAAPLYRGTPPTSDLWPALAARLGEADVVPLPVTRRRETAEESHRMPKRRLLRFSFPELIAASIVTAVLGAGGAWLALRPSGEPAPRVAVSPAQDSTPTADQAVTVSFGEEQYDAAIADLETLLADGRARLDTATVRVIDESLKRIDGAIADARAAIQRDPANAYLTRQVAANMRRKLNLLRTAAKAIAEL